MVCELQQRVDDNAFHQGCSNPTWIDFSEGDASASCSNPTWIGFFEAGW
jgi:hypothetical protein